MADPRIGTDLAGYRITDVIGRGGMGIVYLAEHTGLRRRAALKILAPELAADHLFRERFAAESRLAASIDHPNIVPIYEAGEVDGTLFIAMRYVDGDDLRTRLASDGPLEAGRAVRLLGPIADALDAAHAVGLVHRDVKPANILLDRRDDHPYLTDFGLTKETSSSPGPGLTMTGQFLGTPDYIAPEQIATGAIDGRADQYALACVAFEALTGAVPHERATDLATLFAHLNVDPPDIRNGRPDLPQSLTAVFARGLARAPDERYQDCRSFLAAVAAALVSSSTATTSEPPMTPALSPEAQPPVLPAVACPRCGAANPAKSRFCSDCGMALDATVAPATREVRKLVTILFADVSGSTSLGERLDPETLRALMGRYFGIMKRIIESHGGTVEKFIGDAVMAVFGIPVLHEDDALRAVRAAADIRTELAALDADLTASRGMAVRFRTGLNTGEVVAGDPSAGQTLVTGDAVNTAARIEQAAPPGEILLGRLTYQLVRDAVTVEPMEPISAKGKAEPLQAYRLLTMDAGRAGHTRRLDTPLVGRERELAALNNAFERVASEHSCQLFTLLGAAGVGKSRLVAEFAAGVAAEATVLRGRCLSYGEGITYWPIAEVLRAAAGIDEADTADAARAKLRTLVEGERDADVIAARVANAIGLSIGTASQEELFWAIRKVLEHVARERPIVVIIEDIHWAEPTLLDLIEHIADWSRDAPILLLCPARPELLDTRAGWGGGKLNATNVLLEPLGSEATMRLIAALPGGRAIPPAVEARVTAAAEGNPLYVEEFLGMLIDDGLLTQGDDGAWIAADGLDEVRIPASISALLSARLERLAPDERAVAERASVVGRVFEQAAVAELATDALRPEVGRSLLGLVRKELVRPERSELTAGDAFKFRHILIRDAAYEALPKSERATLHERFADWLERTVGQRVAEYEEIVGHHFEQAHRYRTELGETGEHVAALAERAGIHLAAAGEQAFARRDMTAAETLLQRASATLPVGSEKRLELLLDLGFALFSVGRIAEAEDVLVRAGAEATESGHRRHAIRAELDRSFVRTLSSASELENSREVVAAAVPELERLGDDLGLARAYLVLGSAAWMDGRVEEAVEARARSLAYAIRAGDPRASIQEIFWGAEGYGPAPAVAAIEMLETSLQAASDPLTRAQVLFSLTGLYPMRGRAEDARAAYRDMITVMGDLGLGLWAASSGEVAAFAELIIGDGARAEAALDLGIATLETFDATGYHDWMLAVKALALARQSKDEAALILADDVIARASKDDRMDFVVAHAARSMALRRLGSTAEAVLAARTAVDLAEPTDQVTFKAEAFIALAEALDAAGERDAARQAAERARDLFVAKENVVSLTRVEAILARLSAESA